MAEKEIPFELPITQYSCKKGCAVADGSHQPITRKDLTQKQCDFIVAALNAQQTKPTEDYSKCRYCGAGTVVRPTGEWQYGCHCYDPTKRPQQPKCKTCGDTRQVGEEEFSQGRSVGWKECPDCQQPEAGELKIKKMTIAEAVKRTQDLRKMIDEILDDIINIQQAELDKHRWIPVSERLPKNVREKIDVIAKQTLASGKVTIKRLTNIEWSFVDTFPESIKITHWKPVILPEQALKAKKRKCELCGYDGPTSLFGGREVCEQCALGEKENPEHRL